MLNLKTHRSKAAIFVIGIALMSFGICLDTGTFAQKAEAATILENTGVRPVELDIPAIKKSIPVINVGVTNSGDMDVPHNFVQAGWYDGGPVPGEAGSAVIDGHVDNGGFSPTIAGVFKHLDTVAAGDVITVRLSDGTAAHYKVTDSAVYAYNDFPSNTVFNQTDGAYLKIITCHGTWLPSAKTYSQRLVVTAELV